MWDRKEYCYKIRQRAIDFLGGKCIRCGIDDSRVLEFHHKEPRNGGPTMAQLNYSLGEASKCELLCANCHRIESYYGN